MNTQSKTTLDSKEFAQACKDLARKSFEGKVPQETLDAILALTPVPDKVKKDALGAPNTQAEVTVTAAFIWGTVQCTVHGGKTFDGEHWGLGLAGFSATGVIYTAYNNWDDFYQNATGYHVQCAGVAGGIVQVNWFNNSGVPVGQFNGIAGGVGAMEVGGKGSWK